MWCTAGQASGGVLTCEREAGVCGVQLGRLLMGVHAVTQRQLRHTLTILCTEIVRNGPVVLSCVVERLHEKMNINRS